MSTAMTPPRTTDLKCVLHSDDTRLYSYSRELHHVIPQAWQESWWPGWNNGSVVMVPSYRHGEFSGSGFYLPKKRVWDGRTEACCPTGHRNVHHLLVRIMKRIEEDYDLLNSSTVTTYENVLIGLSDVIRAVAAVREDLHEVGVPINRKEQAMAMSAPVRWLEQGGSIADLLKRRLYGNA